MQNTPLMIRGLSESGHRFYPVSAIQIMKFVDKHIYGMMKMSTNEAIYLFFYTDLFDFVMDFVWTSYHNKLCRIFELRNN